LQKKINVLVVGAGPAGISAAFFLKFFDNSINVKLIERLESKNYKKYHRICGEGISKQAFKELQPIKPKAIIERIKFIEEYYPQNIKLKTKNEGFILNRSKFFLSVIKKFCDLNGVFSCQNLLDFKEKNNRIKAKFSSNSFEEFDYIIAADGANSMIRRKLNIKEPKLKAFIQYIVSKKTKHDTLKFYYDEIYKGDYKYIFPAKKTTKIGFPIIANKNFIKPKKIIEKHSRTIAFGGIKPMVKGKILFVGDAAALTNQITKGGIRAAMVSGKIAAESIVKKLDYEKEWLKTNYANPLITEVYEFLEKANNNELVKVIQDIIEDKTNEMEEKIKFAFKLCELYGW